MIYLFIGLATATMLGIVANGLYGTEDLINHPWVDYATWAIIASGVFMSALKPVRCRVCRKISRCHTEQLKRRSCASW